MYYKILKIYKLHLCVDSELYKKEPTIMYLYPQFLLIFMYKVIFISLSEYLKKNQSY